MSEKDGLGLGFAYEWEREEVGKLRGEAMRGEESVYERSLCRPRSMARIRERERELRGSRDRSSHGDGGGSASDGEVS